MIRTPISRHAHDLELNRAIWDVVNEQFTDSDAARRWAAADMVWGLFGNREDDVQALGEVAGVDVVELGCGTAYFSAWLGRRGARPVAVDLSPAQLRSARRCQEAFDLDFPLIEANAESVPLPDDSFDLAVSEYGASVWCAPELWVAEAARLLRPGGRLVFLTNSPLVAMTVPSDGGPATTTLLRARESISRVQWPGGGVEFHPSHSDWVRVLAANGFVVEALHELHATEGADLHDYYEIADIEWAQQWPVEDLWVASLPG